MRGCPVVAAGVVPGVLVILQAYVSQPLSTGLGLPDGWVLINPAIAVAGLVWFLFCCAGVGLLARVPTVLVAGQTKRRALGAFGLVLVSSWIPVTVFMRLAAYLSGHYEPSLVRTAFEIAVEVLTGVGLLALVGLLAGALFRRFDRRTPAR